MKFISLSRTLAMIIKEFRQILRDKGTLAMIVMMPLMLMLLFGYAINTDPRHLPTAVVLNSGGELTRSLIAAMNNTRYFDVKIVTSSIDEAQSLMQGGKVQFIVHFPPNLQRDLVREDTPKLLISVDATDPAAQSVAPHALQIAFSEALKRDKFAFEAKRAEFELRTHSRYNPELLTRYQIIPGLMGVLLTLTTILMTSISVTKEHERGTMENLLATPLRPLEVMIGKILPYLFIAYLQVCILLLIARVLFALPEISDFTSLFAACTLLMLANLGIGFTFSTLAKNQLQAMQMTYFFFLPSLLLSGYLFPFYGMPAWAQAVGEIFPITHFLRMVRGIWLKGSDLSDFSYDILALTAFLAFSVTLSLFRYKRTLD
ncbi:ABC transporter permease [Campylobacter sp. RM16189]|uniref:ABC transporter permease n=1 Tax=Campylobacter sp. RM16189 TaxID=1705726 RepID=UPI001475ADCB|nr:ABC transporter permease [Campylobacter sp. RM16189]